MSETTENAGDSAAPVESPAEETAAAPAAEAASEENSAATETTAATNTTTATETTENGNGTTSDETSGLERKIIQQLEYYFGDANLARDKFMLDQISKNDGWVPLTVLLTFKRLAGLTTDVEFIVNSIAKSDEGLIEVSEDRQKLRRHPERPVPEQNEERRKEIMSRTAYVKGFPVDTDMSALLDFFAPFEKVVNITMRKYLDKAQKLYKFKGSVFVTFEKREQTEAFIEKPKVSFGERDLLRKWQEKYIEEKRAEVQERLKDKDKKKQNKREEEVKFELPKGTVLLFENATDVVTRELLREVIDKMPGEWEVAYLDYSKGEKQGHIRFVEENIAAKFLEKLEDNKLKINDDVELTLRLLTDEEEQKFLAEAVVQMKNRRQNQGKNKYGNRKRRGGGSGGDYKRRRND